MSDYRKLSIEERARIVGYRHRREQSWHSPPHWDLGISDRYLTTPACYEHKNILRETHARMTEFEEAVLSVCRKFAEEIYAWCILPNHYHVLLRAENLKILTRELGHIHRRNSFQWNKEDGERGRAVWYRCFDRAIRTERHSWASVNYVHNNPVHHGLSG